MDRILEDLEQIMVSEKQFQGDAIEAEMTATRDEGPVDVAIITILPQEYEAVLKRLERVRRPPPQEQHPDICAWMTGEIISPAYERPFRIVVAMAERAGNVSSAHVTRITIERWEPRYVVLVGVAGGLPKEKLVKGDVVISSVIWSYEYGKLAESFQPRLDFTYQVDSGLLRNASALAIRDPSWREPLKRHIEYGYALPKVVVGPVASGDKVVDDVRSDLFKKVLEKWPKLQAIEMEGAGAAAAIAEAQSLGYTIGFLMIRGISDMPIAVEPTSVKEGGQTEQRDSCKIAASDAAATFAAHLIRNAWPLPPRPIST